MWLCAYPYNCVYICVCVYCMWMYLHGCVCMCFFSAVCFCSCSCVGVNVSVCVCVCVCVWVWGREITVLFSEGLECFIPRQLQSRLSFSRHFIASGLKDKWGGAPRYAASSDKRGGKRIYWWLLQTSMKRQLWCLIRKELSKGFWARWWLKSMSCPASSVWLTRICWCDSKKGRGGLHARSHFLRPSRHLVNTSMS